MNTRISEVENKIPNTCNIVTTTVLNTKTNKVENKNPNNSKYIITQEFNKLTAENLEARLKQADSMNKTDFVNKLTRFNRLSISSNKTKHLEVQKNLNSKLKPLYTAFLHNIANLQSLQTLGI